MAGVADRVMGDFELTFDELRAVTAYVLLHAEEVLGVFERAVPNDPRPREGIAAARDFVTGAARSKRQRTTSLDAHRAAAEAPTDVARLAARCAGDAASAPYLHPIADAAQVGHILRAPATAARIAELLTGDPGAADAALARSRERATPVVVGVLCRYPRAPRSASRIAVLTGILDDQLRSGGRA